MIYTVSQEKLVLATANELKGMIEMPEWAQFVKTGNHAETLPRNSDWWYIRAASILRMCHKRGPVGVNKLRTKYGGRKNRGVRPDKFVLASGKVIRVILQQLESAGLIKQDTVGSHKGRVTTSLGTALLHKAAKSIPAPVAEKKSVAKKAPVKKEEKTDEPVEAKAEETNKEAPAKEE